jgi:glutamine---fructose-6-phosphate transaminase (isomerizing)
MPNHNSGGRQLHTVNEITSQGEVWCSVLQYFEESKVPGEILADSQSAREWIFVGCGTSYYLAEAAAASWTALTSEPARALPASEILLFPDLYRADSKLSRAIVVSRSGHTSEAVRAAKVIREQVGLKTIGITCGASTPLEQVCDFTLILRAADEQSMVMTRSFTSMLICLQLLAARRAGDADFSRLIKLNAAEVSSKTPALCQSIESFVERHSFADYVFLGQGPQFGIAREGALKIMEMSCSYSQAFHTLEFRHGPKSIVSPATCLMFFLSKAGYAAEAEVLSEMKELGAVIISVCNEATPAVRRSSDLVIDLQLEGSGLAALAASVMPAQLLGYYSALAKGLDPDVPKNLTRVVMLD